MAFFVITNIASYTQYCQTRAEVRTASGWNLHVPDAEAMDTNSGSFRVVPPHSSYTFSTLVPAYGYAWRVAVRHGDSTLFVEPEGIRAKVGRWFSSHRMAWARRLLLRSGGQIQSYTTPVMEVGSLPVELPD